MNSSYLFLRPEPNKYLALFLTFLILPDLDDVNITPDDFFIS
jgi:hypothetical protein